MKKLFRPLLALSLAAVFGLGAQAADPTRSGYGNEYFAAMTSYDSFNLSVRKRLESVRVGSSTQNVGSARYSSADLFSSDEAYAMAPSSRTGSVSSSYRRRQLDCVYYSGFTVWGDLYQTWAKQRTRGNSDGYDFRTFGPAIGFDWTSGAFTGGIATTYNWGKLKSRDFHHDRKTRTWAVEGYGQYNTDMFYINATLGYGHNSFRSSRRWSDGLTASSNGDKYSSNSWNIDAEFGWKFNFSGLQMTPHIGLRYFHDRRGTINEGGNNYRIHANTRNSYLLEMPIGVDVGYEINAGGAIFIPRVKAAWVPQLTHKRGEWSGRYWDNNANGGLGGWLGSGAGAARRDRNGFNLGAGMEAKITKSLSAHVDYNINFRSKAYEHHWNLGVGFTF